MWDLEFVKERQALYAIMTMTLWNRSSYCYMRTANHYALIMVRYHWQFKPSQIIDYYPLTPISSFMVRAHLSPHNFFDHF